jgi:uncharacterized radical SAM protein YgiQ
MDGKSERDIEFLPMTRQEMVGLGWKELDILLVSGDAYLDQPDCGTALLGRWLVAHGFRTGIVAQPQWDSDADIECMGRPLLFAGVTAGALDSMLAHYTAFRKKRRDDAHTPGGRSGARPNRATIVYANIARHAFPGLPIIIGGVEASMRRATHYDFWTDAIRRSILLDSKADLLIYGMAERAVLEAAERLAGASRDNSSGENRQLLCGIEGTVYVGKCDCTVPDGIAPVCLPAHEEIVADNTKLMPATLLLERQTHGDGSWAVQQAGTQTVVFVPPAAPLTVGEMDDLYSLHFSRRAHPSYSQPVPAVKVTQFSVVTHRGCGGGCSFCSLALHQGRRIQSRSPESVLAEISGLTRHGDWQGSLADVGGPSANMWGGACKGNIETCKRVSCLFPEMCPSFRADQSALAELLIAATKVKGVKHVRVASGVRHDLALRDSAYMNALVREFVGGQLKLAPEHLSEQVLRLMRKPGVNVFERFLAVFDDLSRKAGKEQYVIPYLISAFPGCTPEDMKALAGWLKKRHWSPRQVQCFVPTPGTVATAMYCAGIDADGKPVYVARTDAERLQQHAVLVGRR